MTVVLGVQTFFRRFLYSTDSLFTIVLPLSITNSICRHNHNRSRHPLALCLSSPSSSRPNVTPHIQLLTSKGERSLFTKPNKFADAHNSSSWPSSRIEKAYFHERALKQTIIADLTCDLDIENLRNHLEMKQKTPNESAGNLHLLQQYVEEKLKAAILSFDDKQKKRLNMIRLEYDFLFSEGYEIQPTADVTTQTWLEAMTFATMEERLEFYLNQQSVQSDVEVNPTVHISSEDDSSSGFIHIGHQHSSSQILANNRLVHAMENGPHLIIDVGFSQEMNCQQLKETAKQLWQLYLANRESCVPYHLILSSCQTSNPVYRFLQLFNAIDEPHLLVTVTEKNPTELFDYSELVYLSSRAFDVVEALDPDTVYILGAHSNRMGDVKFLCMSRSEELKIRSKQLPIDKHIRWPKKAPKNLDLQDMMSVLLSVQEGDTWKQAFETVIQHGSTLPDQFRGDNTLPPQAQHKEKVTSTKKSVIKNTNRNKQ